MKPLVWATVAGAVTAAGLLLLRERTGERAPPTPPLPPAPPPAPKTYGETTKVSLAVPSSWRRLSSATPELSAQAVALMNTPGFTSMQYGTLAPFVASDGKTYATWIEQHYHAPGGSVKPWGLHHGVTLLEKIEPMALSDEWPGVRM